ncbi:unnamed protein product [Penicillium camemberti]|uniref:Str. FM013 n=1 Tax=Penicillium camemberti (strain FM 013) TaxID=1429867 RepID=A0A0G4P2Z7_PENC3|nr:unnamed protein product [Penicillium camemberti]
MVCTELASSNVLAGGRGTLSRSPRSTRFTAPSSRDCIRTSGRFRIKPTPQPWGRGDPFDVITIRRNVVLKAAKRIAC